MNHVVSCLVRCVLVLVVYLKIKKNKMKKQVAIQELCCVLLRESVMKHVAVHLVCCVFLLVSSIFS